MVAQNDGNSSESPDSPSEGESPGGPTEGDSESDGRVKPIDAPETVGEDAAPCTSGTDTPCQEVCEEKEVSIASLAQRSEHPEFASRDQVPWFLKEADPDSSRAKKLLWRTKRNVVLTTVTILATLV